MFPEINLIYLKTAKMFTYQYYLYNNNKNSGNVQIDRAIAKFYFQIQSELKLQSNIAFLNVYIRYYIA